MNRFAAVIFDLDGTLLNSIADLADSMNRVLCEMGYAPYEVEAYKLMVGEGVHKLAEKVLPESEREQETIEQCVKRLREEYGKRWAEKTRPYEGIPELLGELTARGMKMSVLSNKLDSFTKLSVSHFFPGHRFEQVMGTIPGVPIKPDPFGALFIARELHMKPCQFLFLGDSNTDMQTAVAAGMFPVGALWGFRSEDELWRSGAKTVIPHPLALLALLD